MVYDVICLGDYFFDQIFTGLTRFPKLGCEVYANDLVTTGGAMFITAVAMTRLGVKVGWPSLFGNDYYSQYVYGLAQAEGVDLSLAKVLDHPYRRVTTAVPFEGERAFITQIDAEDDRRGHWPEVLQQYDYRHVHVGGMLHRTELEPLVAAARAKGATVSMDCQDGPMLDHPCDCRDAMSLVDVFMPNTREALIVAETHSLAEALERLMVQVPVAVIKDGAHGAWIAAAGETIHVPGIAVDEAVDTTGAGDCFNAGFLLGYVVEQVPLAQCTRYGNVCGGLSVTGVGGATAAPSYDELKSHL